MSNSSISIRGHAKLFHRLYSCVHSRKQFFSGRFIQLRNSPPADNDTFKSLATFESFVNSVDLTNFVSLDF